MKRLCFIILCCFLCISCLSVPQSNTEQKTTLDKKSKVINKLPLDTETKKYIEYENGYFKISYIPYLYRLQNDHSIYSNDFYSNPISISYITYDSSLQETVKREGKYFCINEETLGIEYKTDDEFVSTSKTNSNIFEVLKDGDAEISISIGNVIHSSVLIHQITLPLTPSDTADSLIEKLGFPDEKKSYSIKWPYKKTIEGIYYDTTMSVKDIYVTHYYFKKYPYLSLSRGTSTLFRCGVFKQWPSYIN